MANTDKVRLNFNDSRTEVEVVFLIDFGDRVTFGFQGNTVFSKGELNEFITSVRTTGLGRDYLGAIQRKFTDEYRARAYNDVKISTKIVELEKSKHVTFVFDDGISGHI